MTLSPEDVASARFSIVDRGFDCDETLEFLRGVATAFGELQRERDELAATARTCACDAGGAWRDQHAPPRAEPDVPLTAFPARRDERGRWEPLVEVVEAATAACDQLLARAEQEAEALRERGRQQARQERDRARRQARAEIEHARAQAASLLREAQESARSQQAEAQRRADQTWNEALAAIDRLHAQVQRAHGLAGGAPDQGADNRRFEAPRGDGTGAAAADANGGGTPAGGTSAINHVPTPPNLR